jgi:hypothetical protein
MKMLVKKTAENQKINIDKRRIFFTIFEEKNQSKKG